MTDSCKRNCTGSYSPLEMSVDTVMDREYRKYWKSDTLDNEATRLASVRKIQDAREVSGCAEGSRAST